MAFSKSDKPANREAWGLYMQVKLKVLSGTHEGKEISINQEKFLIGRSDSCQLRPKSESISRKHCALVQKDGRLLVVDLKSRNGTFVNEKQLAPEKAKILKDGDMLKVGALEFQVSIEVGLGGAKRPEVKDVKDAAERLTSTGSPDSRVDVDISSWLEEADQIDRKADKGSRETLQFNLDETRMMDMTISNTDAETSSDVNKGDEKKAPIKMPKIVKGPTTKNSRDAASETLKRYFGGRG